MRKIFIVTLTEEERDLLTKMISSGSAPARKLTRARILLKSNRGPGGPNWTDKAICEALDVGMATDARGRRRFVENGLEDALNQRKPRRKYLRKLDGHAEAHLTRLACSEPPEGKKRWTLRLLAEKLVMLDEVEVDSVSHETVRQVLKKTNLNLGLTNSG